MCGALYTGRPKEAVPEDSPGSSRPARGTQRPEAVQEAEGVRQGAQTGASLSDAAHPYQRLEITETLDTYSNTCKNYYV